MSLRKRLYCYLVLFAVIPVLVVGGIASFLARKNIEANALKANTEVVSRVASDVDKMLTSCFNAADVLEDSVVYQEEMRKIGVSRNDRFSSELRLSLNMSVEAQYHPEIFGLYLIGENQCSYKSTLCSFSEGDIRESSLYKEAMKRDTMGYLGSYEGSRLVNSLDYPMLAFGRGYFDKATGRCTGAILMEIRREEFDKLLHFDTTSGYIALEEPGGQIISSVGDSSLYRQKFSQQNAIIETEAPAGSSGYRVLRLTPLSMIIKDARYITAVIIFLCLAVILLAVFISWYLSGSIIRPIWRLIRLMHRVEGGDLSVSIVPKKNDEIGTLFTSFNVMVQKINELMESVQDEQQKLRAAEIRSLMDQINPHFLYNTLDSIVWLCCAGQTAEAAKMTEALANFFRIGLSKGKDVITVSDEIRHVRNYLMIQEIRGNETFDYSIEMDESLGRFHTVKFILQPLVENAIYHGVYQLRHKGHISIGIYEEDDNIVMSVADTGEGLTPEKSEKLRKILVNDSAPAGESYGLLNVNRRIRHFFGPEYGIRFFSVYGKGSTFEIVIPEFEEAEGVQSDTGR